ncbi:MAG: lytic murein transglycosylase, partial [Bauldia sp.]
MPLTLSFGSQKRARRLAVALIGAVFALAVPHAGMAATPAEWVQSFWPMAQAAGVSRQVYDRALANFTPDPDVIKRSQEQAEFNMPIWIYLDRMVSEERLSEGAAVLRQHGNLLARIEERYG